MIWQTCFRDWRPILGPGERGKAIIVATDRAQARGIRDFVSGLLHAVPSLKALILSEQKESISLRTGVDIEIMTANYRSIRGRTVVFAALEELAFWQPSEFSANPSKEVYVALKPSLATVPGGLLVGISTAYSRQGLLWEQVQRYHGKPGPTLVWVSSSRAMNPSLSQAMIDEEIEADPTAARAEWLSVFRDDVESFLGMDLLRSAVVPGRASDVPAARRIEGRRVHRPLRRAAGFIHPGDRVGDRGREDRRPRPPGAPASLLAGGGRRGVCGAPQGLWRRERRLRPLGRGMGPRAFHEALDRGEGRGADGE